MQTNRLDAVNSIDRMVRADKLKLLFQQSFPALFVSMMIALLLCWMIWPETDTAALLSGWLALLSVSTLARLGVFVSYFHIKPGGGDLLRWEMPYAATLILSSLIWGCGAAIVLPRISALDQAVTFFVLIGMAGGAVSTYSAYRYMAVASMASVLLPSTVWLLCQADKTQMGMAIGAIIFMAASWRGTKVLAAALHRSFQLTHELKKAHDIADLLANTDALTGINNRRAFFERGQQLASYCQRHERPLAMLLMDLDHFKAVNDSMGHSAGDTALQHVARTLLKIFRESDVCARIGGEEFAVLLPDTTLNDAKMVAETLRKTIAETPIPLHEQPLTITVSIGVAAGMHELDALLLQADVAMYRAKMAGRNRVIYQQPIPERREAQMSV